jgi:hypothetical protein
MKWPGEMLAGENAVGSYAPMRRQMVTRLSRWVGGEQPDIVTSQRSHQRLPCMLAIFMTGQFTGS